MNKNSSNKYENLRKKALEILKKKNNEQKIDKIDNELEKIIEELNIYQIELELQAEELKKSQHSLKLEKQKYQEFFIDAPIAYFIINKTGNILQLNKAAAKLIEIPLHQFKYTSIFPYLSKNSKNSFAKHLKIIFSSKKHQDTQLTFINNKNHKIFTQVRTVCFENNNQKLCRLAVTDITKLKKTQKKLSEQNKLFELFFSQSLTGFFFMMLDQPVEWNDNIDKEKTLEYVFKHQKITKVNNIILQQYRASEDEFIGLTPYDFFKHDIKHGKAVWRKFFDQGHLKIQTKEKRFDGSDIIIEGDYILLYDENNKITGHFGIQNDITEKHNTQQQLQESQLRWKFAIEGNNDGVWDWNLTNNKVFFSDKWKKMLGYEPEEINDNLDEWKKRVHPDDLQNTIDDINKHINGKTDVYQNEHRVLCKNGSYKWILDRGKIVSYDNNKNPIRMIGTHTDIDQQKKDEKKIKEINKKLKQERQMFVQGNVVVFKWKNKQGWPVEYISPNIKNLLGYSPDEIKSDNFVYSDIIFADDVQRVSKEVFDATKKKLQNFKHEPYRLIKKNGEIIWVQDFTNIIKDQNNKITHFIGYLVDITEYKNAESKIKLLSSLVEQSPSYIFITDLNANIEYVNQAFTKVTGYTFNEVKGKNASILKSGKVKDETYKKLWATIKKGEVWRGEIINKRKDGTEIYENVVISPILNKKNEIIKYFSIKDDITEKKKAEKALKKSEEKFRFLAENSQDMIYRMSLKTGIYEYVNPASENITGYTPQEFYNNPLLIKKIIHPDFKNYFQQEWNKIQKNQLNDTFEYKIIHKNKKQKWLFQRNTYKYDKNDKPKAIEAIVTDITNRKLKQQEAIEQSEQRFKILVENAQVGITLTKLDGTPVSINNEVLKIYGLNKKNIYKLNASDFYADINDRKKILDILKEKGKVKNYEVKFIHSSGKSIFVTLNMSFIDFNNERLLLTTHLDITDEKYAQLALKESEEKFRTFVNNSADAIRLTDEKGKIIFVNKAHQKLTGYNENEVIGKYIWEFLFELSPNSHNRNPDYFNQKGLEYINDKKNQTFKTSYEVTIVTKDNKLLEIQESVFRIENEKGSRLGSIVRDITKLKKQQQELKELVATKDKFFNIIAHDLRSPFNALLGFAKILQQNHKNFNEQKRENIIESIHDSSKAAYKLVENLLTWSRSQTGKLKFNPMEYPVKTLVFEAVHSLKNVANRKDINLINSVTEDIYVYIDKPMTDTILRNLISNALKFTHKKGTIIITAKTGKKFVTISVKDNGIGISKEKQKNLFGIDKNKSTPGTQNEQGTGLGLILCKEFVQKHGGNIWVESEINKGTTFYFTLPLIK